MGGGYGPNDGEASSPSPAQERNPWTFVSSSRIVSTKTAFKNMVALPLVMVSTEAEKSRVPEAIKAGVNNCVVKPFTVDTLSEKVTPDAG